MFCFICILKHLQKNYDLKFFFFQFKYLKQVSLLKKTKNVLGGVGLKKTKNVLGGVGLIGYWGLKIGCWRRKGGGGVWKRLPKVGDDGGDR